MSLTESPRNSLAWRKAAASAGNGSCVQVALTADGSIVVRDSKDPMGPILSYTPAEWCAFLDGAKGGEFDI
jgi:hypothetical protein